MVSKTKNQKERNNKTHKKHRLLKWLGNFLLSVMLLAGGIWVAFQVSPWPNALLIRYAFDKNDKKVSDALQKYVPGDVVQVENRQYRANDKDAYLDVFYPKGTTAPRPTVVWVHGGAWVAGSKDAIDNYMKIFASHGFTTVSVNYSIAPEKQYPVPIAQLNDALEYVQQNAKQLNVASNRIMLAGDSAGSQIVAQMANIITNPVYAREIGVSPKMQAQNLKATLLNCGAYDLSLPDYNGEFGGLLHTVLWAYSGTKDFLHDSALKTASVVNYLTPQFPPSFITAGNVDPLLSQSTEFAKRLSGLDVQTKTLFYAPNHQPQLSHEYQFNLDTSDGKNALQTMVDFVNTYDR